MNRLFLCNLRLIALFVALATPAVSLAGDRVAVVTGEDDAVSERLIRELLLAGFDAFAHTENIEEPLDEIAKKVDAAAVIRLELKGRTIDVWVVDRVTNKTVFRSLEVTDATGPVDAVAVLGAVELLRASLMELHAPETPKGAITPTEQTETFSKPVQKAAKQEDKSPHMSGSAGINLSYLGKGSRISLNMPLALTLYLQRILRLRIIGAVSLMPSTLKSAEGQIKFTPWFVGGDMGLIAPIVKRIVHPYLSAGGGVSLIKVDGNANGDYLADETVLITGVLHINTGFKIQISSRIALDIGATVGWLLKTKRIHIAKKEVAKLGAPMVLGAIAMEVKLF